MDILCAMCRCRANSDSTICHSSPLLLQCRWCHHHHFFFKFKSWYLSFMLPLPLFDRHRRPTRAVHHHSQWPSHQMYDRKRRYIILFNMIFSFDVFIFNFCSTILDKLTISLSLPHSSIVWSMVYACDANFFSLESMLVESFTIDWAQPHFRIPLSMPAATHHTHTRRFFPLLLFYLAQHNFYRSFFTWFTS